MSLLSAISYSLGWAGKSGTRVFRHTWLHTVCSAIPGTWLLYGGYSDNLGHCVLENDLPKHTCCLKNMASGSSGDSCWLTMFSLSQESTEVRALTDAGHSPAEQLFVIVLQKILTAIVIAI